MTTDAPQIDIPNFEILRKIGSGANGTVYEARDALLNRRVALKVWNARGVPRALSETAKIAGLNHPLVVTTHAFGTVDDHPFAVMELVPGVSGKEWLRSTTDVQTRATVWRLFERALGHLHSVGIVHGDPHLGNLIIFEDEREIFGKHSWQGKPGVAMKLADTGTSEFWTDHSHFADREARLIRETATRMFAAERFSTLADGLDGLAYREMLAACDAVVSIIATLNALPESYAYSQVAASLVIRMLTFPVINLDELYRQALDSPMTQVHRVITRLNGALLDMRERDWHTASKEITEETRRLYAERRKAWRSGDNFAPRR